jgi:general secretion pathway protein G
MRFDRRSRRGGFTLIELLVVIIILAVLAVVIIPNVVRRTDEAKVSAARTDISTLENLLTQYRLDNGQYPTSEQGLQALFTQPSTPPLPRNWKGPYSTKPIKNDPWGNPYQYQLNGETVQITSLGADGAAGGSGYATDITNHDTSTGT